MLSVSVLFQHTTRGPLRKIEFAKKVKKIHTMDISNMRKDYNDRNNIFLEEHIEVKEPFNLFHKWFQLVKNDQRTLESNAVFLSTSTRGYKDLLKHTTVNGLNGYIVRDVRNGLVGPTYWDGYPSGRVVLLKGYGKEGFKFFTHYTSRKGQELEENNRAALTFYWEHFQRSVRVEGDVEKLPFTDADEYFSQRPYGSQIGALCSDQSKPVDSRNVLIAKAEELRKKYGEGEVPRPKLWGGYLLKPKTIEFWQGQTDRIHDRIRFRFPKEGEPDGTLTKQGEDGWIYERLCP